MFVGGKRERENTHTDNFQEAENLLKSREGDVGNGKPVREFKRS